LSRAFARLSGVVGDDLGLGMAFLNRLSDLFFSWTRAVAMSCSLSMQA